MCALLKDGKISQGKVVGADALPCVSSGGVQRVGTPMAHPKRKPRAPDAPPEKGQSFRKLLPCPPDGRCFYHAIAAVLNEGCADKGWTADSVYHRVRLIFPGVRETWAEDSDVMHTANALRLNIWIWEGMNGMWTNFGDDKWRRVHLYNPHNVHYDGLVL
jgi:hypothetical protein